MEASVCGTVRCIWPRDQSGEKQRLDGTKSLESRYCVVSKFAHKRGRRVEGCINFPTCKMWTCMPILQNCTSVCTVSRCICYSEYVIMSAPSCCNCLYPFGVRPSVSLNNYCHKGLLGCNMHAPTEKENLSGVLPQYHLQLWSGLRGQ